MTSNLNWIIQKAVVTAEYPEGIVKAWKDKLPYSMILKIATTEKWNLRNAFNGPASGNSTDRQLSHKEGNNLIHLYYNFKTGIAHLYQEIYN